MESEDHKSWPTLGNDVNQCMLCKHLVKMGVPFNRGGQGWRCAAFPGRDIPDTIVMGFSDHREMWGGVVDDDPDNGILFEMVEGLPYTYEDLAGPLRDDDDDDDDEEDLDGEEEGEEEAQDDE